LIEEDALIRVSGKADNTKGEIQIIVDSVSTDLEIVQPAEGAVGLPPYAVTNGGNGSHDSSLNGDDNGDLPDETPAPPVPPEASAPPEDDGLPDWMFQAQPDEAPPDAEPEPAREPARTNGKTAKRAEAESAPAPQSAPPPPTPRVELWRT
jgi:hypothetical protein